MHRSDRDVQRRERDAERVRKAGDLEDGRDASSCMRVYGQRAGDSGVSDPSMCAFWLLVCCRAVLLAKNRARPERSFPGILMRSFTALPSHCKGERIVSGGYDAGYRGRSSFPTESVQRHLLHCCIRWFYGSARLPYAESSAAVKVTLMGPTWRS
jgi:hypothetical protein